MSNFAEIIQVIRNNTSGTMSPITAEEALKIRPARDHMARQSLLESAQTLERVALRLESKFDPLSTRRARIVRNTIGLYMQTADNNRQNSVWRSREEDWRAHPPLP